MRIEPTRHVKPGLLLQKQPGTGAAVMAEDMLGGPWMAMGRHRLQEGGRGAERSP